MAQKHYNYISLCSHITKLYSTAQSSQAYMGAEGGGKEVVLPNESFFGFFPPFLLLLIPLKTTTLGEFNHESFGKPFGTCGQASGS